MRRSGVVGAMVAVLLLVSAPALGQSGDVYQPGFHQALRWSETTPAVTTYRLRIPISRSGHRVRVAFRAGDGSLTISSANIAKAGANGALASTPQTLSFSGGTGFTAAARQRVVSDPLPFDVSKGDELFVSFEADGALSTSSILALPGSRSWPGHHAADLAAPNGSDWYRAIGVATIDVEGPQERAFVAIGDSITEGYVSGDVWDYQARHDDYRNAWPFVASVAGLTFANAGVSGQGVDGALVNADDEIFVLEGITDCVLLIGTNDLASNTTTQLTAALASLESRLSPFCKVWGGTLLPKEKTSAGDLQTVITRRHEVNAWIRSHPWSGGVLELEPVLANGSNIDQFGPGLGEDGIHPSVSGQKKLGDFVAATFRTTTTTSPPDAGVEPQDAGTEQVTVPDASTPTPPSTTNSNDPPTTKSSGVTPDASPQPASCATVSQLSPVLAALLVALARRRRSQ
ncbi:MAG: SGNH/GDSL hydrolase family protein, partial [Myxococcaceae bacterium]